MAAPLRRSRALLLITSATVWVAGCASHARPATSPRAELELKADLDRIFQAPIMSQGLWGVEIKSLDGGRVLYELNPRKLMMPASNMKIVTLAAAVTALGWDYRFTTRLETAGIVENGVLQGDLVVRGSGDPTINSLNNRARAVFDEWVAALRAAGITRIQGGIIGDDNAFDDEWLGAGWSWDYLQYDYAAPVGALEYNEDTAQLTVRPGAKEGEPVFLDLTPGSGFRLVNRAVTGPSKSAGSIAYARHADESILDVTGSLALDSSPAILDVAVVNPTLFFVTAVREALIARGIQVRDGAYDADEMLDAPPAATRRALAESTSPPLRDIATVMMKISQNLYAETLLKAIGAAKGGLGTTEGGRQATRALLASWGIPENTYVQVDGSGLSRYDYVNAQMMVTILEHLYQDAGQRDAFMATLPIAGRDGTLRSRLRKTRAEGNALAKTGSIANARTLSGFVKTRDGEQLAFSILANNFTIPAATVTWIADLAVEVLSNFTRK